MQVYKAYYKIIKKHMVSMLIYFGVFVVVALIVTGSLNGRTAGAFAGTKSKLAFISGEKDSPLVDGLRDYLSGNAQIIDIPDDMEIIRDALFFGRIEYVLRVPEGFRQSFLSGKNDVEPQKTVAAETAGSVNLDLLINKYLGIAELYAKNVPGITESDIVRNVRKDLDVSVKVDYKTYNKPSDMTELSYYFQFIAYSILAILIMGITSIMMAFNETDLSNRNLCSPMSPARMNLQIVLGNVTFALAVWAALCALVFIMHGNVVLNAAIALLCINALVFAFVSLSIGFLAGKFIKSHGAQAAVANVISLGISFLSGVFVEQELLGKTVLAIASFTPGYWYIRSVNEIKNMVAFSAQNIVPVICNILIQLGFAVAFIIIALVVTKQKNANLAN